MSIIKKLLALQTDHEPEGWPAVQMKEIVEVCELAEKAERERDEAKKDLEDTTAELHMRDERVRELENFLALVYYDHDENEMCIDAPHSTRSFWGKTAIECFENFVQYYRELKEAGK